MSAFTNKLIIVGAAAVASVGFMSGCATAPKPEADVESPTVAYSRLWGHEGEVWLPAGRLPDFSFAGYHCGERAIPDYPATTNVVAYGARGDDNVDDTAAFQAALAATESGAVIVPPGRYIISGVLKIAKAGVVLRGSGAEQTTLYFPKPLEVPAPNTGAATSARSTANVSGPVGFVRLEGKLGAVSVTLITAPAARGDQSIVVGKGSQFAAGQFVEIFMTDTPDNSLAKHLYSDDAGDVSKLNGTTRGVFVTRIVKVEGNRLDLERRLRFDVRPEWRPVVRTFRPTVQDSGVEDLTFEFPVTPCGGRFAEQGFNPLVFVEVAHCWARRVKFVNPDNGPLVGGAFNTVSDAVFESHRPADAQGNQGGHGIYLGGIGEHLFTRFDFRLRFMHDISVSEAAGVVVAGGKGVDLCFDQRRRAPYETLFTDLDLGQGTRPWSSGGGDGLGKHAGARVTFWNLRSAGPLPEPAKDFAPWSANFIGVDFGRPESIDPKGLWREIDPSADLLPGDLYAAQLAHRLHPR